MATSFASKFDANIIKQMGIPFGVLICFLHSENKILQCASDCVKSNQTCALVALIFPEQLFETVFAQQVQTRNLLLTSKQPGTLLVRYLNA